MNKAGRGALAGFLATGPMTYALFEIYKHLPQEERSPLPPATITDDFFKSFGERIGDRWIIPATMAAHFAYGATTAIPYSFLGPKSQLPVWVKGSGYGFAIWALSYLGLMPSLNFRSHATDMPWRRNAMMIGAHFVWGYSVASAEEFLRKRGDQMLVGERKAAAAE